MYEFIYLYIEVYFLDKHKGVHIPKPIIYYFTKSFWATLNERSFSFRKCCVTINVRDFFPNKVGLPSVLLA